MTAAPGPQQPDERERTGPLPWVRPFRERQCKARGGDGVEWGRCELRRGHDDLHALDRGMYVLRFGPLTIRLDPPAAQPVRDTGEGRR